MTLATTSGSDFVGTTSKFRLLNWTSCCLATRSQSSDPSHTQPATSPCDIKQSLEAIRQHSSCDATTNASDFVSLLGHCCVRMDYFYADNVHDGKFGFCIWWICPGMGGPPTRERRRSVDDNEKRKAQRAAANARNVQQATRNDGHARANDFGQQAGY